MSQSLILHIGTEKTGTTTLQAFLRENAAALQRAGYVYPADPASAYVHGDAHSPIAASLMEDAVEFVSPQRQMTLAQLMQQLRADTARIPVPGVILSSEHFSSRVREPAALEAFRRQLGRLFARVRVICYVRDQPGMAASAYTTDILTGRRTPFDPDEVTPENPYFDFVSMLDLWSSVFGRENLTVREYSRRSLSRGDICDDFCELCGISAQRMTRVAPRNTSLGLIKLEILRALNAHLPWFSEDESGWREAQAVRAMIGEKLSPADDPPFRVRSTDAALILDRFRSHNALLNERYMGGALSPSWFSVETPEGQEGREEQARAEAEARVLPELARLVVSVSAELAKHGRG